MKTWEAHKSQERGIYEVHEKGGNGRICSVTNRSDDEKKANLIAAAPELLAELAKAHLIINRLVEEIHKADTKNNKIVETIDWPTIGELDRKNVIAKATV